MDFYIGWHVTDTCVQFVIFLRDETKLPVYTGGVWDETVRLLSREELNTGSGFTERQSY